MRIEPNVNAIRIASSLLIPTYDLKPEDAVYCEYKCHSACREEAFGICYVAEYCQVLNSLLIHILISYELHILLTPRSIQRCTSLLAYYSLLATK